ncbi:ThiF family adenylyltransferase [Cellulomonas fengjieae]|uniref:Thiamine biosynthesis protein ThiF n=1 Tax=Cellulomonas fengjieae TaxID=2819978 RepID=A0ABS3SFJ1_9CELL|nr:thiamine biosynthesis protein ThiF [Cellulomonas fengjieae]MBO3083720.1 thiamine biosynthesis protein ThiF [Cellulomonas fengjieae]MBO3101529.1 thiamine biosynthesis protein ThiF [Cellulomonas fengjieae]QVI64977.1 thiamine biosynthesis protein ThiF [Cellulomonas fengjieae]
MRLRDGLQVLRRTATEVQVGTDPRWAVRLTDLTSAEADLLLSVGPRTDLGRVLGAAARRGLDGERVQALVGVLVEARLTDDHPPRAVLRGPAAADATTWSLLRADGDGAGLVRARAQRVVAVLGLGPTGLGIAVGLAAAGVGTLLLDDERPVRSTDVGVCGYRWADAGAPREHVAARILRDVAPHVSTLSQRPADAVVLVEDGVADPMRGPVLVCGATAHLSVVIREADTVVGPFVVPGAGPCLRCLDLHRADADASWPTIATQLRAGTADESGVVAAVCAGLAASAVLAHLDRVAGLAPGVTFEVALPDAVPRRRTWAVHPECGCTALPASPAGAPV